MKKVKKPGADAPLVRAVIYARYSSSGQREESIEGQIRECREFAQRKGFIVVGEYIDRALSGKTDKRPDFQRMLRDSERGYFEVLIMWKMDRFARNRYDSAIYKYKLKKNGIQIFYAKETIPEGPEGIILESVMEGYAEYYSENLSQNIKRGKYDSALELKTLGQKIIGYKRGADGRYAVVDSEAAIVRRIFEEYADGKSAKDIYTQLNEEGHRTSRGGPFNKNSLRRILENEKYIGVYEYADIRVEDGVPAIVDRELFGKVQNMIKLHHDKPHQIRERFLLTGRLYCGHCGVSMVGDGGTSHTGQVYSYYTCNNRRVGKCEKERASKKWIEDLVINELYLLVNSDKFINTVADHVIKFQEIERDRSVLNTLEARQKQNEKAINNMLSAIEEGIITPSTKTRLVELEAERANIEKGIARELINEPTFSRGQVLLFLHKFRGGDINDISYQLALIDTFLNSVYLYDGDDPKLVLMLNYSGEDRETLDLAEKAVREGSSCFAPSTPTLPGV